jgi:hypothetical protein
LELIPLNKLVETGVIRRNHQLAHHPVGVLRRLFLVLCVALLMAVVWPSSAQSLPPHQDAVLSPYWGPGIQRWSNHIGALAEAYGFHPDFIAAVIAHGSGGEARGPLGAADLMSVIPHGHGVEWRSSSEDLLLPVAHLRWGMAILSYVVQQSGGDLFTALAAYNSGWNQVNNRPPREYAARVLDSYGRALVARAGLSPEMAGRWTVAVEIRAGNVPADLLVLGNRPLVGLRTFTEHTVYAYADEAGHLFYVRGFVVPLTLSDLAPDESNLGHNDDFQLEAPLRARLGEKSARSAPGNPRVLLACLPSLSRLRGQVATRWYAPTGCPPVER